MGSGAEQRWPELGRVRQTARQRLRDLIAGERRRARLHIELVRQLEPGASPDRVAHLVLSRWVAAAAVEGGLTGALGFLGVPLNFLLFAYGQVAVIVSIAEAYEIGLDGESGEDAVLDVLGRAHGLEGVVRESPRVLGAIARTLALRHGLSTMGRLIPMVAAPIGAKLNQREMIRTGHEALRRFGNVIMIE